MAEAEAEAKTRLAKVEEETRMVEAQLKELRQELEAAKAEHAELQDLRRMRDDLHKRFKEMPR